MSVRSIRPASATDRNLQLDVEASKLVPDHVVLTVRINNRQGELRKLEILLTMYEARVLGHALLDRANPSRSARGDD
jgi:hypothetical protein